MAEIGDKITYQEHKHKAGVTIVFVNGKKTGEIRMTENKMYKFYPKGGKKTGEEYPRLAGCKFALKLI